MSQMCTMVPGFNEILDILNDFQLSDMFTRASMRGLRILAMYLHRSGIKPKNSG